MPITVALDPNNSAAKNKLELGKALTSFDSSGGEVRLPRSKEPFPIDPGIVWPTQRNITLVGEGRGDAYEASYAGTTLKFTAGTVAFDFSSFTPAGPHAAIENIALNGDNVCQFGLKVHGKVHLNHIDVARFTQSGIHLVNLVNMTTLNEVSATVNGAHGIWVGGGGATQNTIWSANALKLRSNGGAGIRFENSIGWKISNSVIESNYGEGIDIYRSANISLSGGLFENCWLENNLRSAAGYSVRVDGAAPPTKIVFRGGVVSGGGLTKAALINAADAFRFEDVEFSGSGIIDIGAGATGTGFLDCRGQNLNDGGSATWDKSWIDIIAGLGGGGGGGGGGTSVAFHAHKGGTNQTVTASATTKVTFTAEEFDTNNNFASSRFTPTVAGKYVISASVRGAVDTYCRVLLYKNGALYRGSLGYGNGSPTGTVTAVVDMNGSSDYLEVYAVAVAGTTIYGGGDDTYFSGALIG